MKKYDLAIWAHHGMFAAGFDFDLTFGLMHTAEKICRNPGKNTFYAANETPDDHTG